MDFRIGFYVIVLLLSSNFRAVACDIDTRQDTLQIETNFRACLDREFINKCDEKLSSAEWWNCKATYQDTITREVSGNCGDHFDGEDFWECMSRNSNSVDTAVQTKMYVECKIIDAKLVEAMQGSWQTKKIIRGSADRFTLLRVYGHSSKGLFPLRNTWWKAEVRLRGERATKGIPTECDGVAIVVSEVEICSGPADDDPYKTLANCWGPIGNDKIFIKQQFEDNILAELRRLAEAL